MKRLSASLLLVAMLAVGGVATATAADASTGLKGSSITKIGDWPNKIGDWPN